MKKVLSILILSSAIFAVTSNPAHASPPTADHPVILKEAPHVAPVVFEITKHEAISEVYFAPAISPDSDGAAVPATATVSDDTVKPVKNPPSPDDGRIRMYRHYFNHEDNKEYPEYQAEKLSDGFIRPVDRPAV